MKKNTSLVALSLSIIFYTVGQLAGINILVTALGIPLLLYFPGALITQLIPKLNFRFGLFGRVGLSLVYSFIICSLIGLIIQNKFGFNSTYQVWSIIIFDISITLIQILLSQFNFWKETIGSTNNKVKPDYKINLLDYLPILIFAVAILISILVNPIAQDADNYLTLIFKSISTGHNALPSRFIFGSYIELTNRFLNIDIRFIYRNIYVLLFFASTLTLYDYIKRYIKINYWQYLLYLTLLAPAVILSEVNIIRPQVAMIVLTLPVLILAIESIKNDDILAALVALFLSVIALLFHELGITLLLVSLVALLINLYRLAFIKKVISWQQTLLFLIIILPYAYILHVGDKLLPAIDQIKYALSFIHGLHWRWWFINSYTTVDGVNLGWPGLSFISYYLYNGILLSLVVIGIYLTLLYKKTKIGIWALPATLYLIIFLAFAEITPRLGLYFLPNRAWVHLMLAVVVLLVLMVEKLNINALKLKWLALSVLATIVIGYGGTIYVAKNNINKVYQGELPVAEFIKTKTPRDAVILSSQNNEALAHIYGDRSFSNVAITQKITRDQFVNITNATLEVLSHDQVNLIQPRIVLITQKFGLNDALIDQESKIVQPKEIKINPKLYTGHNAVYFLYSYDKLGGLNQDRSYLQGENDTVNKDTYKNLGYPVAFSNSDTLLIKIK